MKAKKTYRFYKVFPSILVLRLSEYDNDTADDGSDEGDEEQDGPGRTRSELFSAEDDRQTGAELGGEQQHGKVDHRLRRALRRPSAVVGEAETEPPDVRVPSHHRRERGLAGAVSGRSAGAEHAAVRALNPVDDRFFGDGRNEVLVIFELPLLDLADGDGDGVVRMTIVGQVSVVVVVVAGRRVDVAETGSRFGVDAMSHWDRQLVALRLVA